MRTLIAMIIALVGFEVEAASVYMCRSYNNGTIAVLDLNSHYVIFKDRFGNELDSLDEVSATITTLDTLPVATEILFTRKDEMVFKVVEQGESIKGETKEDDSFLCFGII